jgi:hypothetical protein
MELANRCEALCETIAAYIDLDAEPSARWHDLPPATRDEQTKPIPAMRRDIEAKRLAAKRREAQAERLAGMAVDIRKQTRELIGDAGGLPCPCLRALVLDGVKCFDDGGFDVKFRDELQAIAAKTPGAAGPKDGELVRRGEVARRLKIHPSAVTRFVAKHKELAENDKRASSVYFEPFRAKWEKERSIRQRDSDNGARREQRVNRDTWEAQKQLADTQPKQTTRRR